MPNWVYNNVTITATPERCAEIKKTLHHYDEGNNETVLSFQKIVPRPPEEDGDWYNWNISHWDTKWDACEPDITVDEGGQLGYAFRTAWSPPMRIIEEFVNANPDVDLHYRYEEEQGWGGNLEVKQGALIKHDQYDVPGSHVELVERSGSCYCESGEQPYFDDCYFEQAKEIGITDPHILEAVKGLGSDWSGTFDELIEASKRL